MRQRMLLVIVSVLVIVGMVGALLAMLTPAQVQAADTGQEQLAPAAKATPTPRPCVIRYPDGGCYRTPPRCTPEPGGSTCVRPGTIRHACAPGFYMQGGVCVKNPNDPIWDTQ